MSKKSISTIFMFVLVVGAGAGVYFVSQKPLTQKTPMSFFVTSANPGQGANFGGIEGADRHCMALAEKAGSPLKNWKAYLSVTSDTPSLRINAKDRIGKGPWYNAKGALIAANIEELHGKNNISKETALTETGAIIPGRGDTPNIHDILTGTLVDGTAPLIPTDTTCQNWTSTGSGSALVGHHDRIGLNSSEPARSWNSSHASRGCDLPALKSTGGGGLLYCFAAQE